MPRSGRPRAWSASRRPWWRLALLCVLALVSAALTACTPPKLTSAPANIQAIKPTHPISLTLLDGGGDLQVNGTLYAEFAKTHPDLVSSIHYETASGPDVLGKLRSQELSNHVDISLIAAGTDVLGPLQQSNLLTQLLPEHQNLLPNLSQYQDKPRAEFQAMANGQGIMCLWGPAGPEWEYDPKTVPDPPKNPQQLLAWAKAHPGRLTYADPSNSGPGELFLMSLPYELHDSNPQDPINGWSKTWAYLSELGKYVAAYPESSTIMNKELADGSVWLVPTEPAMDFTDHQDGVWGSNDTLGIFNDEAWIMDGHFLMVPRGVTPQTLYVDLVLMKWLLQPQQQEQTYAHGAITTATDNAPFSDAGPAGKQAVDEYGRPAFHDKAFKVGTLNVPVNPVVMRTAFDLWQARIGSQE